MATVNITEWIQVPVDSRREVYPAVQYGFFSMNLVGEGTTEYAKAGIEGVTEPDDDTWYLTSRSILDFCILIYGGDCDAGASLVVEISGDASFYRDQLCFKLLGPVNVQNMASGIELCGWSCRFAVISNDLDVSARGHIRLRAV